MKNYYRVLEIDPNADQARIEAAYRVKRGTTFLGERTFAEWETRSLLHKRSALLNEAYRTLRDPASRRRYDRLLRDRDARTLFVVCRHCGHSEEIPIRESRNTHDCLVCGETIELAGNDAGRVANGAFWQQVLAFLDLSRHATDDQLPPNLFHFMSDSSRFTLRCTSRGEFWLFAYGPAAFALTRDIGDRRDVREWDGDAGIGHLTLTQDIDTSAHLLRALENRLPGEVDRAYFSVGDRKHGFAEPNILFISALTDVCPSTAAAEWRACRKNLYAANRPVRGNWLDRLRDCHASAYGSKRRARGLVN